MRWWAMGWDGVMGATYMGQGVSCLHGVCLVRCPNCPNRAWDPPTAQGRNGVGCDRGSAGDNNRPCNTWCGVERDNSRAVLQGGSVQGQDQPGVRGKEGHRPHRHQG